MKFSAIYLLSFTAAVLAQTFEFGLYSGTSCAVGHELSGTSCFDATCDFSSTTSLTGGTLPYSLKINYFVESCGLYLYTQANYGGSYGYIAGADMSEYECIYFTADLPIASIQVVGC